jgi:hypothetical protein
MLALGNCAVSVSIDRIQSMKVADVVFREDLYPRLQTSAVTVQKYADDLSVLPPIDINQYCELIDGWHRWTAHKKAGAETILVVVTETKSDAEVLELAIERNATHGLQLSQEDKRNMARSIYNATPEREREAKKLYLAKILSVSERSVRDWLSRIDKDAKEARDKRIFELWLACWTQEEIAADVGLSGQMINVIVTDKDFPINGGFAESGKIQAQSEHATDFQIPLYNVWKQQEKTAGKASHFGNSETRWVDNLLYLYTRPFEIVVDPFAGGGSTIDLCQHRYRRYWVADREPVVERAKEIRKHDVADGPPSSIPWRDVGLVYLDPPYWKQAEGKYSKDPADLANMSLDDFNIALTGVVESYAKRMKASKRKDPGYIALILQPTQWKAPNKQFTDHVGDMLRAVSLPVEMRYSVPYESQQHNAQMVEWAKANKKCLVLTREIVVWRVE